ncbi:type VI secretion system baseplate subunit TssG [Cupriavidus sp. AU9028]|uniref:type VI secretion system baseplate subunit TssG n=1 Tax=Cupriavidus sp. AU9028 TaxID=2871157 RepID=UPI001C974728|nr:type VI secretion system baseplate subunit TssG [Cupriavidus sp. AU9028]MBY4897513.1 type VI secretion system baseplate subunit TssG [Cupriavidus sp. AU9028]
MRTAKRRIDPGVIRRLLAQPYRFQFFQAVRLLELLFARDAGVDGKAGRQADTPEHRLASRMRFPNAVSLSFPASEIARIEASGLPAAALEDDEAFRQALEAQGIDTVTLTPAFFGLLGGQGALPLHYTEIVAERETMRRDGAARAFFDIFSNRAAALFYQAWKKYRLPFHYEVDRSRHYLPLLLSLGGTGDGAVRGAMRRGPGTVHDEALAGYATALRQRPMSAAYLQQVLTDYFRVPVRIEQFVGGWYRVPEAQWSRLGGANGVLGATALAGQRVWQRDLRVRVWIGPLSRQRYQAFLPGAAGAFALRKMLMALGGATQEYEVRPILRREDVRGCSLGGSGGGAGGRIGWDAFIASRPAPHDRSEAHYTLSSLH